MKKASVSFLFMVIVFSFVPAGPRAATVDVSIVDFDFIPASVTINAGDTVRWTNNGFSSHTSTSGANCIADGIWNGSVLSGQSFSRTFITPGTFPFFCAVDAHCSAFGMQGAVIVNPAATMPVPTAQQIFPYPAAISAVLSTDPVQAKPIGLGDVAAGGNTFRIEVGLNQLDGPVDVYFAVFAPAISPEIFLLTSTGLQPLSAGLAPWLTGITGPLNVTLLSDTPITALVPGTYTLYLAVTPAGSISAFYLWQTGFST